MHVRPGVTCPDGRRASGVALVTAMLVVSLATIAAVAMYSRQEYTMRYTENLIEQEQAEVFARAVETWAGRVLAQDRNASGNDHAGEPWATVLPPITVEGGTISAVMTDLQGRFNLNNLVVDGKPSALDVERFRRLLQVLGLDRGLADAVVDWTDEDGQPTLPGGAEDGDYLRADPPYRAANRPMASISELRLLKGVDDNVYRALEPYVCALPQHTAININTSPGPVLRALAEGISGTDAARLIAGRGANGYPDVQTFQRQEALAGRNLDPTGLDVASNLFAVTSDIQVGRASVHTVSVLLRGPNAKVAVVSRSEAGL